MNESNGAAGITDRLADKVGGVWGVGEGDRIGGSDKLGREREEKEDGVTRGGDHVKQLEAPDVGKH